MNLNDGEFETEAGESFCISMTQESDCSMDGGYSFENITNVFSLDRELALRLRDELSTFLTTGEG